MGPSTRPIDNRLDSTLLYSTPIWLGRPNQISPKGKEKKKKRREERRERERERGSTRSTHTNTTQRQQQVDRIQGGERGEERRGDREERR